MADPSRVLSGKRILFALCGFDLGGAERQALHLARHLKGLGCDVRVWGHHHHCPGPERVIEECEAAGIPWAEHRFRWPCGKRALLRDSWGLLRGLWQERPDLVLSYLPWPSVGCGLIWRFSPVKAFIWGQRDADDLRGDSVERFAYRQSSAVVCNATHEVDYLLRTFGETRKPIHVIHNGVDLAPAKKSRSKWRTELSIPPDSSVVTMVANFRPQKDHGTLLSAWQKIVTGMAGDRPAPRLLLAGAPQESYDTVRRLASGLALLDTVTFLGQVRDVAGLLSATDIGVLVSSHEGMSNSIMEYMTSGLPVVATDLPANRELLGDNPQQPFCKPGDADSTAACLRALLRDMGLRQELGARNRQLSAAEFSIGAMCEKSTNVILDVLQAKRDAN